MGIDKIISAQHGPVADPHLLIRGGRGVGGGRSSRPGDRSAARSGKNFANTKKQRKGRTRSKQTRVIVASFCDFAQEIIKDKPDKLRLTLILIQ